MGAPPFTLSDLEDIEIAIRLRLESAEDNDEKAEVRRWKRVHKKVLAQLESIAR